MGDVIDHIKNEVMRLIDEHDLSHTKYHELVRRLTKELVKDIRENLDWKNITLQVQLD